MKPSEYIRAHLILILSLAIPAFSHGLKLDRVIMASDTHSTYLPFWPPVARAWREIVGIKPTLVLVAPKTFTNIDTSVGDVIHFEPIPGIPTSLQAQLVRLLIPALYPDEVFIVSDIDMLPLSKNFFTKLIEDIPDNCWVSYTRHFWDSSEYKKRLILWFNAAQGSTFSELFSIKSMKDVIQRIKDFASKNIGWTTDEKILHQLLITEKRLGNRHHNIAYAPFPCPYRGGRHLKPHITQGKYGGPKATRIGQLHYSAKKLKKGYYISADCPRPYTTEINKKSIDTLLELAIKYAKQSINNAE